MVHLSVIEEQLKKVGCNVRMWGRSEIKELCHILLPGETIAQAINGQYEAGFAMLVATDFRILLIDKKPKYLTLKDIRFDMITELDFSNRLLNSTILIFTPNRELRFTSWNSVKARKIFTYTQHKVMELRNHYLMQHLQQQQLAKNTPPGLAMAMENMNAPLAPAVTADVLPEPAHYSHETGSGSAPVIAAQSIDPTHPPKQFEQSANTFMPLLLDATDEHRRIAIAMGAAGLQSIVHNGRVIKDYMAVPFTQRWRKRPYGFSNNPVGTN